MSIQGKSVILQHDDGSNLLPVTVSDIVKRQNTSKTVEDSLLLKPDSVAYLDDVVTMHPDIQTQVDTIEREVTDARGAYTTLNDRISGINQGKMYNIEEYGAVGDGVFDNTTIIQDLMSKAGSKVIVIPDGDFKITGSLLINSGTQIIGSSGHRSRIVLDSSSSSNVIESKRVGDRGGSGAYDDISSIRLENFTIESNRPEVAILFTHGRFIDIINMAIVKSVIDNTNTLGIELIACSKATIYNINYHSTASGESNAPTLKLKCALDNTDRGIIDKYSCEYINIENNTFNTSNTGIEIGTNDLANATEFYKYIRISNCNNEVAKKTFLKISNVHVHDIRICDNDIKCTSNTEIDPLIDCRFSGVNIDMPSKHIFISNNIIDTSASSTNRRGLVICALFDMTTDKVTNMYIQNNMIVTNKGGGMEIYVDAPDNTIKFYTDMYISNNTIDCNNTTEPMAGYENGIFVSNVKYLNLQSNTMRNINRDGVRISIVDNLTLNNNLIEKLNGTAIALSDIMNFDISSNKINSMKKTGIWLKNIRYGKITNNFIMDVTEESCIRIPNDATSTTRLYIDSNSFIQTRTAISYIVSLESTTTNVMVSNNIADTTNTIPFVYKVATAVCKESNNVFFS